MKSTDMRKIVLSGCFMALMALPAVAQESPKPETPKYDVFAAYGYVRPQGGQANLSGWQTSFVSNVNNWVGLAVELSGEYGSQTLSVRSPSGAVTSVKADVSFHSLAFGPRLTYRKNERLMPFAQALFGAARGNWKRPASIAGEETSLGAAIGGGFDTKVAEHVSLRIIQAEYLRTNFGVPVKSFRIATGVVVSF